MIHLQYKYKFYLNINHAIVIQKKLGMVHPHTWEITIDISNLHYEMAQFSQIENVMEQIFAKYQDRFINEIPPFDKINPTLENAADYFLQIIQDAIAEKGWVVLMIELSETPTRSYIINVIEDLYKPKKEKLEKRKQEPEQPKEEKEKQEPEQPKEEKGKKEPEQPREENGKQEPEQRKGEKKVKESEKEKAEKQDDYDYVVEDDCLYYDYYR